MTLYTHDITSTDLYSHDKTLDGFGLWYRIKVYITNYENI